MTNALQDDQNPFLTQSNPRKDFFPYETLDFATRLDVLDKKWVAARYTRRQRIRFLDDSVTIFFDFVWGEGIQFANYHAHDLRIIDAIPARRGHVVVLALPRRFHRGEVFEVVIERKVVGAFFSEMNYWESLPHTPTKRLSIEVLAPRAATFRDPEIAVPANTKFDASVRGQRFLLKVKNPAYAPYRATWSKK
jgi:hypothetical protein